MTVGTITAALLRILQETSDEFPGWGAVARDFYNFIAPYNEFLIFLVVLWLFARKGRTRKDDFNRRAQEILDAKYRAGEISRKTYERYRQDISLRPPS